MINILHVVIGLFIVLFVLAPIVMMGIVILKMDTRSREPKSKVSLEHIAQLEQNDNIIVEDINDALSAIMERLEAIEAHLERGCYSKRFCKQEK